MLKPLTWRPMTDEDVDWLEKLSKQKQNSKSEYEKTN